MSRIFTCLVLWMLASCLPMPDDRAAMRGYGDRDHDQEFERGSLERPMLESGIGLQD